ncbi:MAG: hypothetical protein JOY64_07340 [Alphaproteobacteria bacterium]|nr:hypothetical protein [Alphaproteobacteria bacterium]MBV8407428.1 hypothetical protein [Alphaproteobacteria bacterium]
MTSYSLTQTAPRDGVAGLRAAARSALTVSALAAIILTVLAVRYVAFEYAHGVRPIVQRLVDSAS